MLLATFDGADLRVTAAFQFLQLPLWVWATSFFRVFWPFPLEFPVSKPFESCFVFTNREKSSLEETHPVSSSKLPMSPGITTLDVWHILSQMHVLWGCVPKRCVYILDHMGSTSNGVK